jgi:hypothetical protein
VQELGHQPIGTLAFALEFGSVARCQCLEPRDLGLQHRDLCG